MMTQPHSRSGWRRVVRPALVSVVLVLVALVALEGLTGIAFLVRNTRAAPVAPENFRQARYDTLLGWVGSPNLHIRDNWGPGISLTTNADGMRIHRPVTPALAPNERRIICSGDSFTFGAGVADSTTFCALLETEFPGVRTLNMAQQGYGIDQMYWWYRRDAVRYPHQVHLFAFIWNDFERMALKSFTGYPKSIITLKDGKLVPANVPVPRWKSTVPSTSLRVATTSRLMGLIQSFIDTSDEAKLRRVDAKVWDIATSVFKDLQRLNTERGSKLVLVYLPAPADLRPGPYDVRREKLIDFARQSGIPLIDLTPEIRTIDPDSLNWLFITTNGLPRHGAWGHYSDAGHKWAADRIAEHLKAMPEIAPILSPPPKPQLAGSVKRVGR